MCKNKYYLTIKNKYITYKKYVIPIKKDCRMVQFNQLEIKICYLINRS